MQARKIILFLPVMLFLMVGYTNCGRSMQLNNPLSASTKLFGGANNGGGHSGKLTYAYTNAIPTCSDPEMKIEIEDGQARSFTYQCSGAIETAFDITKFISFAGDPLFTVYEDRIYAHESVLSEQSATTHSHFELFCAGVGDLDFAIKYTNVDSRTGSLFLTTGLLIRKNSSGDPTVESEPGIYREAPPGGVRIYTATSKNYEVRVSNTAVANRKTAVLNFGGGRTYDLNCFARVNTTSE
jgi:hypothetical protein